MSNTNEVSTRQPDTDVIIIGAGLAGIYAAHRIRDVKGFGVRGFERASGLGGVWEWNRYPGARCDVESMQYSYSFSPELEQEWRWSERFATQSEILDYVEHVADRFDVRKVFQFSATVTSCVWDEENSLWAVTTSKGETHTSRYIVSCVGALSAAKELDFPGLENFKGEILRSFDWPHEEVDFSNKRVGLFGTGSTGVQITSELADKVGHLTVFQRTAGYAIPAQNRAMTDNEWSYWKKNYRHIRRKERQSFGGVIGGLEPLPSALAVSEEERNARYAQAIENGGKFQLETFEDIYSDMDANKTAGDYVADLIRKRVDDPATAELLCPNDHPFASKRLIYEINYFEAFNQDNIDLVSIKDVPVEITETGVSTPDGNYEFDTIIFATGFDAFTRPLFDLNIVGRDGLALDEKWQDGPLTYLGISTHGFPNLFTVLGPQSAVALYNNILAIEDHVDLISNALEFTRDNGYTTMESDADVEIAWTKEVNDVLNATIFPKAKSWYLGDNVPGKPRVAMMYVGGAPKYRRICADIVANLWEGYTFDDVESPTVIHAHEAAAGA